MSRVIHCQLVRFGAMLVQCEFYSTMSLTGIDVKRVKAVDKDFCLSNDKGLRLWWLPLAAGTGDSSTAMAASKRHLLSVSIQLAASNDGTSVNRQ